MHFFSISFSFKNHQTGKQNTPKHRGIYLEQSDPPLFQEQAKSDPPLFQEQAKG